MMTILIKIIIRFGRRMKLWLWKEGTLFDPQLVGDLINKVKGHSSLAKLAPQIPVAFNGNKEFTFSMDKEVDVVAESGAKISWRCHSSTSNYCAH